MLSIQAVDKTEHKLQFGAKFKVRQVEIATNAHLSKHIVAFKSQYVGITSAEIEHGIDACHKVRTVVVEPRCCENKVESRSDIGRFHVLSVYDGLAVDIRLPLIFKHQIPISEVHCRHGAQLKVAVKAQFTRYTYHETWVVAVLFGGDVGLNNLTAV